MIAPFRAYFRAGLEERFSSALFKRLFERLESRLTSWESSSADILDSIAIGQIMDWDMLRVEASERSRSLR